MVGWGGVGWGAGGEWKGSLIYAWVTLIALGSDKIDSAVVGVSCKQS